MLAQIASPVAPRVARPNSHLALRVVRWPAAFGDILQEHHSALGEDAGPSVGRKGKTRQGAEERRERSSGSVGGTDTSILVDFSSY